MRILDFKLPESCRVSWVSEEARKVWQPRASTIENQWADLERLSVLEGRRDAALQYTSHSNLPRIIDWAYHNKLGVLLVGHSSMYGVRFAITNKLSKFQTARESDDVCTIGQLLGYPTCCIEFFHKTWVELERRDTTWAMALGTIEDIDPGYKSPGTERAITLHCSPYTSTMLNWLGVRFVPHLPCSFNCEESIRQGKENENVWKDKTGAAWAKEMLSWPAEYSALHGIAEIKTPIVRILSNTDATPCKYTVRVQGVHHPHCGARGLVFPFIGQSTDTWTDNGFSSEVVMNEFHEPILRMARERIKTGIKRVIDLGCGNGLLLNQIADVELWGCEIDKDKLERGRKLHKNVKFHPRSLYDFPLLDPMPTLILLSTQRLEEARPDQLAMFLPRLADLGDEVMLYGYDDYDPKWEQEMTKWGWQRTAQGHDLIVMKKHHD